MGRINCTFGVGLIGLFLFLMGTGFFWFGTKNLIRMWAWENLTLKNNSEAMERWLRPPEPISMKVYIFNVTNPEAVSEGEPPIFSEIGPYVYEQHREKVNVIRLENYTLSYQLQNNIQFKHDVSGPLKDTDMVTVLNVPLIGAILSTYEAAPEFVGYWDELWRFFFPGQHNIFITTSVREVLFDGIVIDCTSKVPEVYIACRGIDSRRGVSIRKEGKNFKFSFFSYKNGTSKETYQISQGVLSMKNTAQFVGMDYLPSIDIWRDAHCDMINGSDGAQFPVMLNKNEKLYIFERDICRSFYIEFEDVVNRKGVELYKYSTPYSLLASPDNNPDNRCFCRRVMTTAEIIKDSKHERLALADSKKDICFKDGAFSIMACIGSQMAVSFPHFYLGDESYLNYSNFKPVKNLHESAAYIEPFSGITVLGYKRLQFNHEVKRIEDVEITSNLVDCLFPILWVEEGVELPTELFKLLRLNLIKKKVLEYGTMVLIGFGLFLIVIAYIVQSLTNRTSGSDGENLKKSEGWPLDNLNNSNWTVQRLRNNRGFCRNSKINTSDLFTGNVHNNVVVENKNIKNAFSEGGSKGTPFLLSVD